MCFSNIYIWTLSLNSRLVYHLRSLKGISNIPCSKLNCCSSPQIYSGFYFPSLNKWQSNPSSHSGQKLESALTSSFISLSHSQYLTIPVVSPSRFIQNLTTAYHLHYLHPSPSHHHLSPEINTLNNLQWHSNSFMVKISLYSNVPGSARPPSLLPLHINSWGFPDHPVENCNPSHHCQHFLSLFPALFFSVILTNIWPIINLNYLFIYSLPFPNRIKGTFVYLDHCYIPSTRT